MTHRKTAYIAHQLSGDIVANRKAASEWVAWAACQGFAPNATWIVLSQIWTEEEGRELGIECDCAVVAQSDVMLLCGPRVSDGMRIEVLAAVEAGVPVIDLTGISFRQAADLVERA